MKLCTSSYGLEWSHATFTNGLENYHINYSEVIFYRLWVAACQHHPTSPSLMFTKKFGLAGISRDLACLPRSLWCFHKPCLIFSQDAWRLPVPATSVHILPVLSLIPWTRRAGEMTCQFRFYLLPRDQPIWHQSCDCVYCDAHRVDSFFFFFC